MDPNNDSAIQEWTTVRRGKHRGNQRRNDEITRHTAELEHRSAILTAEQIQAEYTRCQSQWRTEACFATLRKIVLNQVPLSGVVSNAVCFGTGSYDRPDAPHDLVRTAHVQTDAFLAIVGWLSKLLMAVVCFVAITPRAVPCLRQKLC